MFRNIKQNITQYDENVAYNNYNERCETEMKRFLENKFPTILKTKLTVRNTTESSINLSLELYRFVHLVLTYYEYMGQRMTQTNLHRLPM